MSAYKMAYAKTHLATLIKAAIAGDDVVIAKDETPLVRLVPVGKPGTRTNKREGGDLEGSVSLPEAFFAPMRDDDASEWGL
jgi:antitoxin (DNA-binding transcriptional repressor) of toxin-antitoxin stability system